MRMLVGALAVVLCLSSARGADVADLIKQLKDRDSDTRRAAAKALGEAGGDAKVVVPALVGALKDRDRFVRRFAAQSLGDLGPEASAAVPALRKALDDSRMEVQEAAVTALGKIGPTAVQALIAALEDPDALTGVRRRAAESLGKIGGPAKSAIPALTAMLQPEKKPTKGKKVKAKRMTPETDVRVEVATALGALAGPGDKAAVDALTDLATNKKLRNRDLKKAANVALRRIKSRK